MHPRIHALTCLLNLPDNRFFQLFVDGDKHVLEDGAKKFEWREPNCVEAFYKGLKFAIDHLDEDLNIGLILKFHEIATKNVISETYAVFTPGVFRDGPEEFGIPIGRSTEAGFEEFLHQAADKSNYLNYVVLNGIDKEKKLVDIFSDHEKNSELDSKEIFTLNGFQYTIYPRPDVDLATFVKQIIDTALKELEQANTHDKKIFSIAKCAKNLELLHPFSDANGRTFINIMLNTMLIKNGFPPATFYQPNIFDMYSVNELVDVIKDGISHTLFAIENPDAALFGYKPDKENLNNNAEESEIAEIKKSIKKQINSVSYNPSEYLSYMEEMKEYVGTAWNGTINLHRDSALGNVGNVIETLKQSPSLINQLAPNYTAPLYRGRTPFHIAAHMNQLKVVEALLAMDPKIINQQDYFGNTALHYAVETGNEALIELLLKYGANISIKNFGMLERENDVKLRKLSQTPLERAARYGSAEIFNVLYSNASQAEKEQTLFFDLAIHNGNVEVLNWLKANKKLEKITKENIIAAMKLSMNHMNIDAFWFFLHELIGENKQFQVFNSQIKSIMPRLLQRGGDSIFENIIISLEDEESVEAVIYEMFSAALSIYQVKKDNSLLLSLLDQQKENLKNIQSSNGRNLLHLVSQLALPEVLTLFLNQGIDINQQDNNQETPLYVLIYRLERMSDFITNEDILEIESCVDILLTLGADPSIKNEDNFSPLDIAAKYGRLELFKKLLSATKPDDLKIKSLFLYAVGNQNDAVSDFLLTSPSLNIKNQIFYRDLIEFLPKLMGKSESEKLFSSCIENDEYLIFNFFKGLIIDYADKSDIIIDFIASQPSLASFKNEKGNNLLHVAIKSGNTDFIKALLDNGLDINQKNDYGQPSFFYALMSNDIELMSFLCQNSAINVNMKIEIKVNYLNLFQTNSNVEQRSFTPLTMAILADSTKMVELLLNFGATVDEHTLSFFNELGNKDNGTIRNLLENSMSDQNKKSPSIKKGGEH